MKLTYLFHSGFAVESPAATVIFDYFRDTDEAFVRLHLASFPGPIYVLASHGHPDHFRKETLEWKRLRTDIRYIFSHDILQNRQAAAAGAFFLAKGDTWSDGLLTVSAFGSTDIGVSFLVETAGRRIFHAGDLNNWHWKEESTADEARQSEEWFLREVDDIRQAVDSLDLAMFPVDPALGPDYMRGAMQFVERIPCRLFAPMHFGQKYAAAAAFRPFAERAGCRFTAWNARGQQIEF
ncbi:MAG: MBL fold metallo-hydrolase [Tannerella sp.]|nr:MBL fold metallo-hydrolase [Tannerella sp.]